MSITLSMVDERLKNAVSNQLAWDPEVDASLVGVTAKEGVLTLSGYVDTCGQTGSRTGRSTRLWRQSGGERARGKTRGRADRSGYCQRRAGRTEEPNRRSPRPWCHRSRRLRYAHRIGGMDVPIRGCQPNGLSSICAACVEYSTTSLSSRPSLQKTSRSGSSKPCIGMPILTRVASTSRPQGPMSS